MESVPPEPSNSALAFDAKRRTSAPARNSVSTRRAATAPPPITPTRRFLRSRKRGRRSIQVSCSTIPSPLAGEGGARSATDEGLVGSPSGREQTGRIARAPKLFRAPLRHLHVRRKAHRAQGDGQGADDGRLGIGVMRLVAPDGRPAATAPSISSGSWRGSSMTGGQRSSKATPSSDSQGFARFAGAPFDLAALAAKHRHVASRRAAARRRDASSCSWDGKSPAKS